MPSAGPTPGGEGSSTPWYAEPPAPYGPARGGYRAATGPFWGSGPYRLYPYRQRRPPRWARRPPSPKSNVIWLVICVVTLGLLFPIPAIICWVRAFRFRATSIRRPPALAWFVWAVVFTVLAIGTYTGYIIAGSSSSNGNNQTANLPPPKTINVAFGSTARLVADVGGPKGVSPAPVAITVDNLIHRPHSGFADVNVTTGIRVCATSANVDPLSVSVGVALVTAAGNYVFPSFDWPLPDVFYRTLPPHQCASGSIGFKLPTGARIQSFYWDGDLLDSVSWKVT